MILQCGPKMKKGKLWICGTMDLSCYRVAHFFRFFDFLQFSLWSSPVKLLKVNWMRMTFMKTERTGSSVWELPEWRVWVVVFPFRRTKCSWSCSLVLRLDEDFGLVSVFAYPERNTDKCLRHRKVCACYQYSGTSSAVLLLVQAQAIPVPRTSRVETSPAQGKHDVLEKRMKETL